jgi:hypothetical protein
MKKEYKKPEIMFESFALSTNIAACTFQASFDAALLGACKGYPIRTPFGVQVVFIGIETGCQTEAQNGEYKGVCYHAPTESYNLLNS